MISYESYSKIRDSKGLKDGKVAELAGIGRSTFSDWKSGRSTPKEAKLIKIADALEVSYTYLIGLDALSLDTSDVSPISNNENNFSSLSDSEKNLIETYRNLDEESKRQLVLMLAFLKDQNNKK